MITDKETNFVYLSNLLEKQSPIVFRQLSSWFDKLGIYYAILPHTKDLWVVDFMPLQIRQDYFLQYTYDPNYLKPKVHQGKRTDPSVVCAAIGITPYQANVILDGGNIVKHKNKVVLTTKIFKENESCSEESLIESIQEQLQVKQVVIIPQEPSDFVGHADGMVRFINEDTVLLNEYPKNKTYQEFGYALRACLHNAGLSYVGLPYTSWQNKDANDASGCYINFLEIGEYIFYPTFNSPTDSLALERLQLAFKDRTLIGIDCRDLAKFGGVLNCATWNIILNQD